MATTEQVDILLRTVGDTSGATQVSQALQQTQQSATQVQSQLSAQQQFANTVLRQSMSQVPQTLAAFEAQKRAVEQQVGARPTLIPEDVGIRAAQATAGLSATTAATKEVGEATRLTASEFTRFGAAAVGVGLGLSAFSAAGAVLHTALSAIVDDTTKFEQAQRANTLALGQQAQAYQSWADVVSQQAGLARTSLLEAGTAAEQFGRQIGFGPQQVQGLTAVAAALAQLRGADVGQTMGQLAAAMNGNQQAAQALGLQLDSAYIAFTQLGGASEEVFNQLDPSTQAWLRYGSAVEQAANQAKLGTTPTAELANAMNQLGSAAQDFATTVGTPLITALAGIATGADNAVAAIRRLNEITVQRSQQTSDEGFKNEAAALDALGQKINEILPDIGKPIQDAQQNLADLGKPLQDANDALKNATGFDAAATAANALGQAIDGVKTAAQDVSDVIVQPFVDADVALRQAQQDAENLRQAQVAALTAQVAGPTAALAAARTNELNATRELVRLKQEQVSLGADEARIRLSMLPAQEQMLELQNQTNQAQLAAMQQTLPATRALQDMQLEMSRQQAIAGNPFADWQTRMAAVQQLAELQYQRPGVEQQAIEAQQFLTPYQRNAEDVQRAAQLQASQLQAALFGPEYQRQQDQLLGVVADAARQAAQRDVNFDVQAINVIVQGAGVGFTDTDYQHIVQLAGQAVADAIHTAVQSVNDRGARPTLTGAGA